MTEQINGRFCAPSGGTIVELLMHSEMQRIDDGENFVCDPIK